MDRNDTVEAEKIELYVGELLTVFSLLRDEIRCDACFQTLLHGMGVDFFPVHACKHRKKDTRTNSKGNWFVSDVCVCVCARRCFLTKSNLT